MAPRVRKAHAANERSGVKKFWPGHSNKICGTTSVIETRCEKLREKMEYISGHLASYADAPSLVTESGNILDMLEKS